MMIEEQLLKIKNYDYINQIALKGKILFTGSSLTVSYTHLIDVDGLRKVSLEVPE